jgi:hypothetical protein
MYNPHRPPSQDQSNPAYYPPPSSTQAQAPVQSNGTAYPPVSVPVSTVLPDLRIATDRIEYSLRSNNLPYPRFRSTLVLIWLFIPQDHHHLLAAILLQAIPKLLHQVILRTVLRMIHIDHPKLGTTRIRLRINLLRGNALRLPVVTAEEERHV